MKLEFIPWSENVEIQLCDDDGSVIDKLYTANTEIVVSNPGADAEHLFHYMDCVLTKPRIGGAFADYHPYWKEREGKRAARAAKLGLTQ